MAIDLKSIDEHLAKAREDAEFWEKARAILMDPRIAEVTNNAAARPAQTVHISSLEPRVYGDLMQRVLDALPNPDDQMSVTTSDIVRHLTDNGYKFQAKEHSISVNGALVSLQEKGLARATGKLGNAKLWRKGKQENQETAENDSQGSLKVWPRSSVG